VLDNRVASLKEVKWESCEKDGKSWTKSNGTSVTTKDGGDRGGVKREKTDRKRGCGVKGEPGRHDGPKPSFGGELETKTLNQL